MEKEKLLEAVVFCAVMVVIALLGIVLLGE